MVLFTDTTRKTVEALIVATEGGGVCLAVKGEEIET
jgi:hypothetical protein